MPPAPGLFSTITVWPKVTRNRSLTSRAITSGALPAGADTTIRIGVLPGCAAAGRPIAATAKASAERKPRLWMKVGSVLGLREGAVERGAEPRVQVPPGHGPAPGA